jgi:hypothetical protein
VVVDSFPHVYILSPRSGVYASGALSFQCLSHDWEDGDLDSAVWRSSLAGSFGVGTDFQAVLPEGKQTIFVSVLDSQGHRSNVDSARIEIIGPLTLQTTGNLDRRLYIDGDTAAFTVNVVNNGVPRANVGVTLDIVRMQTGGIIGHFTTLTDQEGTGGVRFAISASDFPIGPYRIAAQTGEQGFVGQELDIRFDVAVTDTTGTR